MTAVMKSSECWISWVTPIPSQMPMAPPKSDTIVVNVGDMKSVVDTWIIEVGAISM